MKVYWSYSCHENHVWYIFRPEDATESPADCRCPFGHDAISMRKDRPVDEVQITLRPAGRYVNPPSKTIAQDNLYYLLISTIEGTQEWCSDKAYGWETALQKAAIFRGKTLEHAKQFWDRLKL